jgi:transmembrane sensor
MLAKQQVTEPLVEEAVRFWTRRHSGTWTDADEAELQAWLTAAAQHRVAYEKVTNLWVTAGGFDGRTPRLSNAPLRSSRSRQLLAVCTALLVAALIVPLWDFSYDWWNGVPVRWVAERGAPKPIVLEDGTRILLDADSELWLKLGARVRRGSLVRGEALFSVVHDASRPFQIEIGTGRITALGTRFDVERLQDSTRVSVFEGRVGVVTRTGEVLLSAGRRGGFDGSGALLPVREVEDSAALSPQGQRYFEGEPLADVIERLMRYHATTFVFANPQLKQLRLNGTFRMTNLQLFLRTLTTALPIEAHWTGPQRVELRPRAAGAGPSSRYPVSPSGQP